MNPFVVAPAATECRRREVVPNKLLLQALQIASGIAEQRSRKTGNWGVAIILQIVISAYSEGDVGRLASHVLQWQAQRATSNHAGCVETGQ